MRLLARLTVGRKLLLLVLLPLCALLALVAVGTHAGIRALQDLEQYRDGLAAANATAAALDAVTAEATARLRVSTPQTERRLAQASRQTDALLGETKRLAAEQEGSGDLTGRLEGVALQINSDRDRTRAPPVLDGAPTGSLSEAASSLRRLLRDQLRGAPELELRSLAGATLAMTAAIEAGRREQGEVLASLDGDRVVPTTSRAWAAVETSRLEDFRWIAPDELRAELDATSAWTAGTELRRIRADLERGAPIVSASQREELRRSWSTVPATHIARLRRIAARSERLMDQRVDAAVSDARSRLITIGVLSGGLLLLVMVVGMALRRSITVPLAEVSHGARRVAAGDFRTPVTYSGRNEIGDVARAFRSLRSTVAEVVGQTRDVTAAVRAGEYTHRTNRARLHGSWQEVLSELDGTVSAFASQHAALTGEVSRLRDLVVVGRQEIEGAQFSETCDHAAALVTRHTGAARCEVYERGEYAWTRVCLHGKPASPVFGGSLLESEPTGVPWNDDMVWGGSIALTVDGDLVGRLVFESEQPEGLSPEDEIYAEAVGHLLSAAARNRRMSGTLEHLTLHDVLTGLPNRAMLNLHVSSALERAKRTGGGVAVLTIGIDRFSVVNDGLGHTAGDALLVALAQRLRDVVRAVDLISRFGGDEFVVATEGDHPGADAQKLAQRVQDAFATPFDLDGNAYLCHASIGIAVASDPAVITETELIENALTAMHRAKHEGGDRVAHFASPLRRDIGRRIQIEQRLRDALQRDALMVNYQPIVDLATNDVVGYETLARWHDDTLGDVPPGEFIPMAEELGLMPALGRLVLRRAARTRASLPPQAEDDALPRLTVNVSVKQLADPGFLEHVRFVRAETRVPAHAIAFEITESTLFTEQPDVAAALEGLRSDGVPLVIDDFGAGYSSLAYLTRLSPTILKLDRTFADLDVRIEQRVVVEAVVAMAERLGLYVIAEGIERPEQATLFRQHGCTLGQGYLFGRPSPAPLTPWSNNVETAAHRRTPARRA